MQRFCTFFFGFWFLVCLGQSADKPAPAKTSSIKETTELEAKLMAGFKAFAKRKRDYVKRIAKEKKIIPPPVVWEFFDEAMAGDFVKAQKHYKIIQQLTGLFGNPNIPVPKKWMETVRKVWPPILEVFGAMETVDGWHAKFLRYYTKEIIGSIPKGSIYFGGTDHGRFAITLGCASHERADPFYTITQNRLADGLYLKYLRELYGKRIYIPTDEDNQAVFADYMEQAKRRMFAGTVRPGENVSLFFTFQCLTENCGNSTNVTITSEQQVTISSRLKKANGMPCKRCGKLMKLPDPRVGMRGNVAVMGINALFVKKIFKENPDRDFFVEESFPLEWMKPHMIPHGLIFKLEREPLKELKPEHMAQNRKYWAKYTALFVGDVVKPETSVKELCQWIESVHLKGELEKIGGDPLFLAHKKELMTPGPYRKGAPSFSEQKAFSKMRSDQAGLYVWRSENTKDGKLKAQYAKEADYAYRQSFALGPINPDGAYRCVNYLNSAQRFEEAKMVAQTFGKLNVDRESANQLLVSVLRYEEGHWFNRKEFDKAIKVALELVKIDKKNKDQHMKRIESYRKLK
jgi:hypothetical protein